MAGSDGKESVIGLGDEAAEVEGEGATDAGGAGATDAGGAGATDAEDAGATDVAAARSGELELASVAGDRADAASPGQQETVSKKLPSHETQRTRRQQIMSWRSHSRKTFPPQRPRAQ